MKSGENWSRLLKRESHEFFAGMRMTEFPDFLI